MCKWIVLGYLNELKNLGFLVRKWLKKILLTPLPYVIQQQPYKLKKLFR